MATIIERPRGRQRSRAESSTHPPENKEDQTGGVNYGRDLTEMRDRGIHAVMGGIALPNDASVRLHEKFDFKKVALFAAVGFKFNRWIDVGYWQRVLDASSPAAPGADSARGES